MDISVLIYETSPDVFILTETWLSSKIPNNDISIDGHIVFRCDCKSKGGGVLIFEFLKKTASPFMNCHHRLYPENLNILLGLCFGNDIFLEPDQI